MSTATKEVIAVSVDEMREFGCPHCGYRSGTTPVTVSGTALWVCAECNQSCCVLASGLKMSCILVGDSYPTLQVHPRKGIPCHGTLDVRPGPGGEFFSPRGIGCEFNLTCFCCGARGKDGYLANIAAFVRCKAAGERVVAMFKQGAYLDYRDFEPDRVQVKIGACPTHLDNLKMLEKLTLEGILTEEILAQAMA